VTELLPEAPKIRLLLILLLAVVFALVFPPLNLANAAGRTARDARIEDYEGRQISAVEVVIEGPAANPDIQAEFVSLLKVAANTQFSAVRVRDSLQALFDSGRVGNARVEVVEEGASLRRIGGGCAFNCNSRIGRSRVIDKPYFAPGINSLSAEYRGLFRG